LTKLCIAYYSRTGKTKRLVEELSRELRRRGIDYSLHLVKPRKEYSKPLYVNPRLWVDTLLGRVVDIVVEPSIDVTQCNAILLATPIWIGRVAPPTASFVSAYLRQFRGAVMLIATSRFGGYCRAFTNLVKRLGIEPSLCIDVLDKDVSSHASDLARSVASRVENVLRKSPELRSDAKFQSSS